MLKIARRNGLESVVRIDGSHLLFDDKFCDSVFTSTVLLDNDHEHAASLLLEMTRVAGKEVHLFEDTAPVSFRDRRSHWLRPPSWYVSRIESQGYELTFQRRLPLTCQEIGATFARVLVDRKLDQGARPTNRRLRLEGVLMSVARPMDRIIPPTVGLTRMSFRRKLPVQPAGWQQAEQGIRAARDRYGDGQHIVDEQRAPRDDPEAGE